MELLTAIFVFNPITTQAVVSFVVILLLLCASAMLSGSETSFFSLSPTDVNSIKSSQTSTSKAMLKLLGDQDTLLATILIMNNLVNICIVIMSNNLMTQLMTINASPVWNFIVRVGVVTFVLLLFGEIIPKIFAAYNPVRFAKIVASPLVILRRLLKPFSFLLVRSSSLLSDSQIMHKKINLSIDELSDAIEITKGHTEEEKQMLSEIVDFVNTEVEEIMRQRLDIVAIDIEEGFEKVKKVINESGFSRIPIYEQTLDNIKGILYVKDMLRRIGKGDDFRWQDHLRKPYFIPEHKKINDLMVEFQNSKVHMGIVVDEYGSTLGLVSLEDILEEIVGEISDESDIEQATYYTKLDDKTYIFDGRCHINEFCDILQMEESAFDELRGESETVAGLMLEIKKDFLKKGESVSAPNVKFTALSMVGHRIDRVKVELKRD